MKHSRLLGLLLNFALCGWLTGCSEPPPATLFVIVNPVVNDAHRAPVPGSLGTERGGLRVRAGALEALDGCLWPRRDSGRTGWAHTAWDRHGA